MTDDRLELDLRAFLVAREPAMLPAGLADRVAAIPDVRSRRLATLGRVVGDLARVAVVAAAALGAVAILGTARTTFVTPGGGSVAPGPDPDTFEALVGAGIASAGLPIVPLALLALATLAALRASVVRGRRRIALGVGAIVIALLGWVSLSFEPLMPASSIHGPGVGAVAAPASDGGAEGPATYPVGPDGELTFGMMVGNGPTVGITVLGIADPGLFDVRLVGVGVARDPHAGVGRPQDGVDPFRPFDLPPGGHQSLVVAARGGPCVATAAEPTGIVATLREVPVVYDVLGVRHVTPVELIEPIVVPIAAGCAEPAGGAPGATGGGPIATGTGFVPPVRLAMTLPVLAAIAVGGIAAWLLRRRVGWLALVVVAAAVPAGAAGAFVQPLAVGDGRWANGSSWVRSEAVGVASNPVSFAIYAAEPGEPITWGFEVRNPAPVPVTLLGVAVPEGDPIGADLVALGSASSFETATAQPGDTRPFRPVTLEPGGRTFVVVVARADGCADPDGESVNPVVQLDLVFESLGWRRTERAAGFVVPAVTAGASGCLPGGSVSGQP